MQRTVISPADATCAFQNKRKYYILIKISYNLAAAKGLLTMRGVRTSHAAVVARQMGKICVVNCTGLEIDHSRKQCNLSGQELREGEVISIDGNSGNVYIGSVEFTEEKPVDLISLVRAWEQQMQF